MPLKKCSVDGKGGWKWGDQGHCYPGKEGKKKAIKQGIAVEGPEKFAQIASENIEDYDGIDLYSVAFEAVYEETQNLAMSAMVAQDLSIATYIKRHERDKK